jgi:signal peptidase I
MVTTYIPFGLGFDSMEDIMSSGQKNTATVRLSGEEMIALIEPLLREGIAATFRVHGSSMYPFIRDGDIVTVTPRRDDIRPGDVVAVKPTINASLLLHRVIAKDAGLFLISGDNAAGPDGYLPMSAIIGIVTRVQRKGRYRHFGQGPERTLITILARRRLIRAYNVWRVRLGGIKRLVIRSG